MLARAKMWIKQQNLSHISAMQGDVGKLPFEDHSFDAILSAMVPLMRSVNPRGGSRLFAVARPLKWFNAHSFKHRIR